MPLTRSLWLMPVRLCRSQFALGGLTFCALVMGPFQASQCLLGQSVLSPPPARLSIEKLLEIQPLVEGNAGRSGEARSAEATPSELDPAFPSPQVPSASPAQHQSIGLQSLASPIPAPPGTFRQQPDAIPLNSGQPTPFATPAEHPESSSLMRLLSQPLPSANPGNPANPGITPRPAPSAETQPPHPAPPAWGELGSLRPPSSSQVPGTAKLGTAKVGTATGTTKVPGTLNLNTAGTTPATEATGAAHGAPGTGVAGAEIAAMSRVAIAAPGTVTSAPGTGSTGSSPAGNTAGGPGLKRPLTETISSPDFGAQNSRSLEALAATSALLSPSHNTISPEDLDSLQSDYARRTQGPTNPDTVNLVANSAALSQASAIPASSNSASPTPADFEAPFSLTDSAPIDGPDLDAIPSFQPYPDQPQQPVSPTIIADPIANEALALMDFPAMRNAIRRRHQEEGPSTGLQLQEATFFNQCRQFERAIESLNSIDRRALDTEQKRVLAIQQGIAGVGAGQLSLVQTAAGDLQAMRPSFNSDRSTDELLQAFADYLSAQIDMFSIPRNYPAATQKLQSAIDHIRSASESANPIAKQELALLLIDVHAALGRSTALGPYKDSAQASGQWFDSGRQIANRLVDLQQASVFLKIHCLLQQIETAVLAQKTDNFQILFSHLLTIEKQIAAELVPEDRVLLDRQTATALTHMGIVFFENREFPAAQSMATEASKRVERSVAAATPRGSDVTLSADLHWLLGSLALNQGRGPESIENFDLYLAHISQRSMLGDSPEQNARTDQAQQGEKLATVAVAFWAAGRQQEALALAQASVAQIQEAIQRGAASPNRLTRPLQNWQQMQATFGQQFNQAITAPSTGTAAQSSNVQSSNVQSSNVQSSNALVTPAARSRRQNDNQTMNRASGPTRPVPIISGRQR